MIHSATPVANIIFCCFVFLDLKSGDGRTTCKKRIITTGRDFGLAELINNSLTKQTKQNKFQMKTLALAKWIIAYTCLVLLDFETWGRTYGLKEWI